MMVIAILFILLVSIVSGRFCPPSTTAIRYRVPAVALTVNASGAVAVKTTVLLTPEEVDAAANRSVDYRPPGG